MVMVLSVFHVNQIVRNVMVKINVQNVILGI